MINLRKIQLTELTDSSQYYNIDVSLLSVRREH